MHQWIQRLRAAAQRTISAQTFAAIAADPAGFADERGHRPHLLDVVLRHVLCRAGHPVVAASPSQSESADVRLWRWLLDPHAEIDRLLTPDDAKRAVPLLEHRAGTTIEVWTESELAALHAIVWASVAHGPRRDLLDRAMRAAAHHVEHIQPDNATNHPWAIHVFALRAVKHNDAESDLFAQTLLHNCQVTQGRPDRLSALVLHDAANALEAI